MARGFAGSKRLIALVLALVLAGVATVAIASYVRGIEDETLREAEAVEAFVATSAIPAGMSAEDAIAQGFVVRQPVPRRNIPAGAISALGDIEGKVASHPISVGEEILASRWALPAAVTDRLEIPEGMHAISVEVGVPPGVAGYVTTGDLVGVLALIEVPDPDAPAGPENPDIEAEDRTSERVEFLMQRAEVLAVGQRVTANPEEASETPDTGPLTTVLLTLAVTPSDAEKVAFATLTGDLYFTLMPPGAEATATSGRTNRTVFEE